jgi:hypothetical protein
LPSPISKDSVPSHLKFVKHWAGKTRVEIPLRVKYKEPSQLNSSIPIPTLGFGLLTSGFVTAMVVGCSPSLSKATSLHFITIKMAKRPYIALWV